MTAPQALDHPEAPTRWDIQALRGLAVGWVLLHHAQVGGVAAGYLGVDIFFVISGYLITGQVLRGLAAQRFSLVEFYARRARRLLPAAYTVLALTALAAPWMLNPLEQRDYLAQHWGAVGLVSNGVLWLQTGYFSVAAEHKPLLHFWSLSLEEQYYLLLPALMLLAGPRRRGPVLVALVGVSFLLGLLVQRHDAGASFYGLPTRAWELGLGSLGAWWVQRRGRLMPRAAVVPAVLLLLLVPIWPVPVAVGGGHPGLNALLVTGATLALLLAQPASTVPGPLKPLVRLGDLSYSVYLVHWPLIAFVNNAWVGPVGGSALLQARLAALALSLPLAWALWRWVEQPTRRWPLPLRPRAWLLWGSVSVALALLPLGVQRVVGAGSATNSRAPNYGLSPRCDQWQRLADLPECRTAGPARWVAWGDSYAMHLVPGLQQAAPGLRQATQSSCGPMLGLAPWRAAAAAGESFSRKWARQCESFNRSVLAALAASTEGEVVLLSSLLQQYLGPDDRLLRWSKAGVQQPEPQDAELAVVEAVRDTARALRAAGKRVLWVAPPPSGGFDAGACGERQAAGRWSLGAPEGCRIDRQALPPLQQRVNRLVDRIEREAGVPVLRLEPLLCDERWCRTVDADGLLLYRDSGHLSVAGSARLLAPLGPEIERLAR